MCPALSSCPPTSDTSRPFALAAARGASLYSFLFHTLLANPTGSTFPENPEEGTHLLSSLPTSPPSWPTVAASPVGPAASSHCLTIPRRPSRPLLLSSVAPDCFPSKTSSLTRVYRPCPSCVLSSAHFLHLSSRRPHSNLWPVLIPWTCQAAPTSAPLPCSVCPQCLLPGPPTGLPRLYVEVLLSATPSYLSCLKMEHHPIPHHLPLFPVYSPKHLASEHCIHLRICYFCLCTLDRNLHEG